MLLLVAAVGAMIFKNSPFGENYIAILQTTAEIRIGSFGLDKPLFLWINDGLMAVFFFLVGMEIKREAIEGSRIEDKSYYPRLLHIPAEVEH